MARYWFLTSTFYGNWLPGDPRGFVSSVRDLRPGEAPVASRHEHDLPGTPYDKDMPELYQAARETLKGEPIRLRGDQARALLGQFQETARCRGWQLIAAAIIFNHVHLVVEVEDDPSPSKVLGDLKAYGSRALTARWGKPVSETWWTSKGSTRKLPSEVAVGDAVGYVRRQRGALVIWVAPGW